MPLPPARPQDLPGIDRLLRHGAVVALVQQHGHSLVASQARSLLDGLRQQALAGALAADALRPEAVATALAQRVAARLAPRLWLPPSLAQGWLGAHRQTLGNLAALQMPAAFVSVLASKRVALPLSPTVNAVLIKVPSLLTNGVTTMLFTTIKPCLLASNVSAVLIVCVFAAAVRSSLVISMAKLPP